MMATQQQKTKPKKTPKPWRVERLNFRLSGPQVIADEWRGGKDRICRFQGACTYCRRRTYAFDDGENDPRGMLGDHAASPATASEYGYRGPDVPACFGCMNEEHSYDVISDLAKRRYWKPIPDDASCKRCGVTKGTHYADRSEGKACSYFVDPDEVTDA